MDGEHALEFQPVERRFDRARAGCDQEFAVRLLVGFTVGVDRHHFGVGVDVDDFFARPQVDIPFGSKLLGCDGDEVVEIVDVPFT